MRRDKHSECVSGKAEEDALGFRHEWGGCCQAKANRLGTKGRHRGPTRPVMQGAGWSPNDLTVAPALTLRCLTLIPAPALSNTHFLAPASFDWRNLEGTASSPHYTESKSHVHQQQYHHYHHPSCSSHKTTLSLASVPRSHLIVLINPPSFVVTSLRGRTLVTRLYWPQPPLLLILGICLVLLSLGPAVISCLTLESVTRATATIHPYPRLQKAERLGPLKSWLQRLTISVPPLTSSPR